MTNRRLFMYATQTKLVEEESFLFHKLGFDVYTAAWATNQTTHFLGYREFHPKHFYQGSCDFLSDCDKNILSKIDVEWGKLPRTPTIYYPDVAKVLLDNFDAMYVSAPTPWLLYAEDFLKAGKIVVYRSFGYPPYTWGKFVDLDALFKYDKFHVVTCVPLDQRQYQRSYTAVTMLNVELIESLPTALSRYTFTIFPDISPTIKKSVVAHMNNMQIPWTLHDYSKDTWKSHSEINKLFAECFLYLDLNNNVRYTALEAILYGKVAVIKDNYMLSYMRDTGLTIEDKFWYTNYESDLRETILKLYLDEPFRNKILEAQKVWLTGVLDSAVSVWCKVLEVKDDN